MHRVDAFLLTILSQDCKNDFKKHIGEIKYIDTAPWYHFVTFLLIPVYDIDLYCSESTQIHSDIISYYFQNMHLTIVSRRKCKWTTFQI